MHVLGSVQVYLVAHPVFVSTSHEVAQLPDEHANPPGQGTGVPVHAPAWHAYVWHRSGPVQVAELSLV